MSKKQWLMIIGLLTIALPFLGFPSNLDSVFFVILGIIIIAISYRLPTRIDTEEKMQSAKPYVEQRNEGVNINRTGEQNMNL